MCIFLPSQVRQGNWVWWWWRRGLLLFILHLVILFDISTYSSNFKNLFEKNVYYEKPLKKKNQWRVHKFVMYQTSDCLGKEDRVYFSSAWNTELLSSSERNLLYRLTQLLFGLYSRNYLSTRARDGSCSLEEGSTLNWREIGDKCLLIVHGSPRTPNICFY